MKLILATLTVALLAPQAALAAPTPTPTPAATPIAGPEAQTHALVQAFMAVTTATEAKPLDAASRAANAEAFARLDGFFAWDTLAKAPFTPHQDKLSEAQLARLRAAFRETVRWVAYPDSGDFFRKARWKVEGTSGTDVTLHASLPEEDVETRVTFHWRRQGDALRIVDVSFDGASLVLDYANQFGRIIAKNGADDLVRRLEERRNQERAARAGLLP